MTSPKSTHRYAEPTGADLQWLPRQIQAARGLVATYAGISAWPENQLADLDRAYAAWAADQSETKPGTAEVTQACGAAVGALVARRVALKWMVRKDAPGAPVLWGRSASGGEVVCDPVVIVGHRTAEGFTQFLAELAEGLCEELADSMAR